MTEQRFDPQRVDIKSFAATAAQRSGEQPLSAFARLDDSTLHVAGDVPPPTVRWAARGERRTPVGSEPQAWLHLEARTQVTLECQRCLQPYVQALEVDRWFRFARDEDEAAVLDEESDDDVLVLVRQFDLNALIEDELILALPLVPRHGECPEPLLPPEPAADPAVKPAEVAHPFAALAGWRKKPEGE